jgi:RNA polymerase sigma-70 factor (ECF subfamily)
VRAWLLRAKVSAEDIDDLIQEAYCKLTGLDSVDHIDRPDAYFFSIVRNLLVRRLRRAAVVPFSTIAEIEAFDDGRPSPEQEVAGRRDFERVLALVAQLPERCRRVFEMRKIEGISQREIAEQVGIAEKTVEYHVYEGVKAITSAMRRQDEEAEARASALSREEARS